MSKKDQKQGKEIVKMGPIFVFAKNRTHCGYAPPDKICDERVCCTWRNFEDLLPPPPDSVLHLSAWQLFD